MILIANNHYRLDLFSLGERDRLDGGLLHLYAAAGILPWGWHEEAAAQFLLDAPPSPIRVARDGEPVELEPPIEFAIEPQALRMLLPRVRR